MALTINGVLDMAEVADDLRKMRMHHGYSQQGLAKKIGVSQGTVRDIESGKVRIWLDDFEKWLEACDITLAEYIGKHAVASDLITLQEDREIAMQFERALKVPEHRNLVRLYLDQLISIGPSPTGQGPGGGDLPRGKKRGRG